MFSYIPISVNVSVCVCLSARKWACSTGFMNEDVCLVASLHP